jgi:hypothetical protein
VEAPADGVAQRCDNTSLPVATIGHWRPCRPSEVIPMRHERLFDPAAGGGQGMSLMVVYIALLVVGQSVAVMIGMLTDLISKAAGLAVFLGLYFAVFVVCWKIAVWLTNPGGYIHARLGR